jgi:hypothetical protein
VTAARIVFPPNLSGSTEVLSSFLNIISTSFNGCWKSFYFYYYAKNMVWDYQQKKFFQVHELSSKFFTAVFQSSNNQLNVLACGT